LLGQLQLYCQSKKLHQFWNEYAFTKDLTSQWALEIDLGLRATTAPSDSHIFRNIAQLYMRLWVHYYPSQCWKFSVFYAYFQNKLVDELNQEKRLELRSALQCTYILLDKNRFKLNLRGRFEDRHIKKGYGNFETIKRLCFQMKAVCPLKVLMVNEMSMNVFVSEDFFFNAKSSISRDYFFDRNRLTLGLRIPIDSDLDIELSYVNETTPTVKDQYLTALQFNLIFNNFLPILENRLNALKLFQVMWSTKVNFKLVYL
jgi:hypothetical protein